MTTEQLSECGCVLMRSGNLDTAVLAGNAGVQRVVVVNYLCPLGADGFARVSVLNGVAEQVFR